MEQKATSKNGYIKRVIPFSKSDDGKSKGGFGFIQCDDNEEVFFSLNNMPEKKNGAAIGAVLEFDVIPSRIEGKRPRAINIRVLGK